MRQRHTGNAGGAICGLLRFISDGGAAVGITKRSFDMRTLTLSLPLLAAGALALGACAVSPYGTGYGNSYNPVYGSVGALGSPYAYGGFSQAAASACANYASRYGRASVRNVQQLDRNHVKVFGYVNQGYRNEGWDCTVRSDGRITDFDL